MRRHPQSVGSFLSGSIFSISSATCLAKAINEACPTMPIQRLRPLCSSQCFFGPPRSVERIEHSLTNVVTTLQSDKSSGSRVAAWPCNDCSASSRLASMTSDTASRRFFRASSSVAPCVFAPGNSSTNVAYPPASTFTNTAVSSIQPSRIVLIDPDKWDRQHSSSLPH